MLEYSYRDSESTEYHSKDKEYELGIGIILGFA